MAFWQISVIGGLAVLLGTVAMLQGWLRPSTAPQMTFTTADCTNPPKWEVNYSSSDGAVRSEKQGWWMPGKSGVGAQVCGPGKIRIDAEGESAEGPPELLVTLDGRPLAQVAIESQGSVETPVPGAGHLQLLYLNDYIKGETRLIEFRNLRLQSRKCPVVTDVVLPSDKGGGWASGPGIGTLYSNEPATIQPCEGGRLTLTLQGEEAQNEKPVIRISQAGDVLYEADVSVERSELQLMVTDEPLQVQLLNPYTRKLADRNLKITSISWKPGQ